MYLINPEAKHQHTILLISGWGYQAKAWPDTWLNALQKQFRVYCVDTHIPSVNETVAATQSASTPLNSLTNAIDKLITGLNEPNKVHLLGWSLGGQMAWYIAQRYPHHIASIITLASNPCFVQQADWPYAMDKLVFTQFATAYNNNPTKALKRFVQLQVQGTDKGALQANLVATLLAHLRCNADHAQGLQWLLYLDARQAWQALACPSLAVLAQQDSLVPSALAKALDACKTQSSQVMTLPACHALAFEYPQTNRHNPLWQAMQSLWQKAMPTALGSNTSQAVS